MQNVCAMGLVHGDVLINLTVGGVNLRSEFTQSPIQLLAVDQNDFTNQEQTECNDTSILMDHSLNKECYPTYSCLDSGANNLVYECCRKFGSKDLPNVCVAKWMDFTGASIQPSTFLYTNKKLSLINEASHFSNMMNCAY